MESVWVRDIHSVGAYLMPVCVQCFPHPTIVFRTWGDDRPVYVKYVIRPNTLRDEESVIIIKEAPVFPLKMAVLW